MEDIQIKMSKELAELMDDQSDIVYGCNEPLGCTQPKILYACEDPVSPIHCFHCIGKTICTMYRIG